MVIIQWSLHKRLCVTLQDRMGCKEGNANVRSIANFEVPDVLVCLPLSPQFSFTGLPHFLLKLLKSPVSITSLGSCWNRVDKRFSLMS